MKLLFSTILSIIIAACSNSRPVSITIQSEVAHIDSVKISSYGVNEIFLNVNASPQQRKINMKTFSAKEGAFTITIFQKDSIVFAGSFGYYAAENEIKKEYKLKILKDYSVKEDVNY